MIRRFQGEDGHRRLITELRRQRIIHDNKELAEQIGNEAHLLQVDRGDVLIKQDGVDNELFFILTGRLCVKVNGREVAIRGAGQHVGEMSLIDPSARRSASVVAMQESVVAKISEPCFASLATESPRLWRLIAVELGERLRERNKLVRAPNPRPVIFIGSSTESLPIAREIRSGLRHDDILIRLWADGGVFGASQFPIEDLESQVNAADFAVLVLGPDDKVTSRSETSNAPRDNVVFELGLFMGALSRQRSFIVLPAKEDIKIPTDLMGLTPLRYRTEKSEELSSLLAPVCDDLRSIVLTKGPL